MKVVTPKQMNEIDRMTIEKMGIPGIVLMENAALRVVEEVMGLLYKSEGKKAVVFAGKGNNGGDALAVARHLHNKNAKVTVYLLADKAEVAGDARTNLHICENTGVSIVALMEASQLAQVKSCLAEADVVIDGIFGTGLRGAVQGLAGEVIGCINSAAGTVIAIDIPSGISGETGKILGDCVRATKTVTFGMPKTGLLIHPGCEYAGELVVADIGIPAGVVENSGIRVNLTEEGYVSGVMPKRYSQSNKSSYGKVLVVSGSVGMTGAGCLCAGAALRSGAGLVYLGVPAALSPVYDISLAEAITVPLEDKGTGRLCGECIPQILAEMERMHVAAIGPGLSVSAEMTGIISSIVENSAIPLILDADALNALSGNLPVLKRLRAKAVVTPHPGEMARLAGVSIEAVQDDRLGAAKAFSREWGVITVLKGSRTVIADPAGHVYINPTGNAGMATGGTGDVLTGIIAGLAGQGVDPWDAAIAGVYIHGLCGDRAAADKGQHGLIAGDLISELPYVIKELAMGKVKYSNENGIRLP